MPKKKIFVLCDGTWCGESTNTDTNIELLARKFLHRFTNGTKFQENIPIDFPSGALQYFRGIGTEEDIVSYLVNATIASDIKVQCLDVYEFIVNKFEANAEVWMFGLSRGAYIVRCVAGMIHNCGIINKRQLDKETKDILLSEVYRMYRDRSDESKPSSNNAKEFRRKFSYHTSDPPIKFMGLLDTVGSLGIPQISYGSSLTYNEFYDTHVSNDVQYVYQALSIHDRLSAFEPCFVSDSTHEGNIRKQMWFPGAHYDIGRQHYKFARETEEGAIDKLIFWTFGFLNSTLLGNITERLSVLPRNADMIKKCLSSLTSIQAHFNARYADYVLTWMIECINKTDTSFHLPYPTASNYGTEKTEDVYAAIVRELKKATGKNPNEKNFLDALLIRDRYIDSYQFKTEDFYQPWISSLANTDQSVVYGSNSYKAYVTLKNQ